MSSRTVFAYRVHVIRAVGSDMGTYRFNTRLRAATITTDDTYRTFSDLCLHSNFCVSKMEDDSITSFNDQQESNRRGGSREEGRREEEEGLPPAVAVVAARLPQPQRIALPRALDAVSPHANHHNQQSQQQHLHHSSSGVSHSSFSPQQHHHHHHQSLLRQQAAALSSHSSASAASIAASANNVSSLSNPRAAAAAAAASSSSLRTFVSLQQQQPLPPLPPDANHHVWPESISATAANASSTSNNTSIIPERDADDGSLMDSFLSPSSGWSDVGYSQDPSIGGVPPSARSLHAAALLNGILYVFGRFCIACGERGGELTLGTPHFSDHSLVLFVLVAN